MIMLQSQPTLTDLHRFIYDVPSYPISVGKLINIARQKRIKQEVINFYRSFPEDEIFTDREDILARTEQVEIMHRENPPEEDFVRGAED